MTENQRLKILQKELGFRTQGEFAEALGMQQGSLSDVYRGKNAVSSAVKNILAKLYNVNIEWLETGIGNNLIKRKAVQAVIAKLPPETMLVPLVQQYAYAGYLASYGDQEYIDDLPTVPFMVDKEYKGRYMAFEVRGDSMDNGTVESYLDGDLLLCREVQPHHWKNKFHYKKYDFVIVHRTDGILIKRITQHDLIDGHIIAHSLNPEYDDIRIALNDIAQIFNVVIVQRLK